MRPRHTTSHASQHRLSTQMERVKTFYLSQIHHPKLSNIHTRLLLFLNQPIPLVLPLQPC